MLIMWSIEVLVLLTCHISEAIRCDRRPFRTKFPPTESNGRFHLTINRGVDNNTYLPDQQYVVTLAAEDLDTHLFTAFMVWPEGGSSKENPRNSRARIEKDAGYMRIHDKYPVKISDRCPNTIEMLNAAPTNYVEMYWKSPMRGNGCVTLHAMVAENEEVWYQDGYGLLVKVCEDDSYLDDISAAINENCNVCEEAKYELKFEGKWSRNTHPQKFPENDWIVYYGDMIGASHSPDYNMWKDGSSASEAMKELALRNKTDLIETEILENYAKGYIRTLIKGKGHGPMNGDMNDPTYALVRVDRLHHLISTATALRPSPDWFMGVSEFELCQKNNTWLQNITLGLIPWDAGVNGGISFESPPEPSDELVGRVRVGSFDRESPFYNMNYKQVKHFATLTIRLIRTYPTQCEEEENPTREAEGGGKVDVEEETVRRTTPPPQTVEPNVIGENSGEQVASADDECPLSNWEEWTPCSNKCGTGYRSRSRYHIVDGDVEYRYYRPDERKPDKITMPSEHCIEKHVDDILETDECTGPCVTSDNLEPASYRQSRTVDESIDIEDCVMSFWSSWTDCSASCGPGQQLRSRSIIRHPRNGGQPCPTNNLEVRECISDPC